MAATTLDQNFPTRGPLRGMSVPLKTGQVIPRGVLVMVNVPSTGAANATDTANTVVLGISAHRADQTAGDTEILVHKLRVKLLNGGNITAAHVGIAACVKDNQTVDLAANTTNAIVAGYIEQVDPDGVWVDQTMAKTGAT